MSVGGHRATSRKEIAKPSSSRAMAQERKARRMMRDSPSLSVLFRQQRMENFYPPKTLQEAFDAS
jgi:hypothetical protein